ncbi:MAG TPA: hypothetical protein VGX48_23315 [Pyrinomonadaceae bacterium]|jgi:hypothetical protein|nr:hypothetical protein [Pyrinomonadaceae bacterium]
MIVCAYEDRPSALVGLKLLLLSLARQSPGLRVRLYCPAADAAFESWVAGQPDVELRPTPPDSLGGWDVKPTLLLELFDEGHDEVFWLDTDLIVTSDVRALMGGLPEEVMVAAEEHPWALGNNSPRRTEHLGLEVARIFPRTLNAGVLRMTPYHRPLLERWNVLLRQPAYRESQGLPFDERLWYFGCDQDLLSGLLGSTEFAHIPVHLLRAGPDIAHCFCDRGYTTGNRIGNLFRGLPPLVHGQGPKPWELTGVLFAELSPYCAAALPYAGQLGEPASWMRPRSAWGRLLNGLTLGNPNLRDLPLVAAYEAGQAWHSLRQRVRGYLGRPAAEAGD